MANGGFHHCAKCNHFKENTCQLRSTEVYNAYLTTCRNWNTESQAPEGPLYAIVCEVKESAEHYADIPYYRDNRAETFQVGEGDTVIQFIDETSSLRELPDIESYMKLWNETHSKK